MPDRPPSSRKKPRVCAECEHCAISCFAATHGQKSCVRRTRQSNIHGTVDVVHTAEYERAWLWRFLGFDTCGPEGRFWKKRKPLCPPTGGSAVAHPTR